MPTLVLDSDQTAIQEVVHSLVYQGHDEIEVRKKLKTLLDNVQENLSTSEVEPEYFALIVATECHFAKERGFQEAPRFAEALLVIASPSEGFLEEARRKLQSLRDTFARMY